MEWTAVPVLLVQGGVQQENEPALPDGETQNPGLRAIVSLTPLQSEMECQKPTCYSEAA